MSSASSAFADRVALVTGSTRGIGRAIAVALVDAGAAVVVHGRARSEATRVADEIGAVLGVGADLEDRHRIGMLVDAVHADVGPIEILVNNAGISIRRTFLDSDTDLWTRTLAVDLVGPIELLRATLPGMVERGWGRVLNVASAAGVEATPGFAAYATAKGGLVGLTLTLAAEVRRSGVRVNALSPIGMTDMLRQLPPAELEHLVGLGVPTTEHCARRALALLDDDAPTGVHELMAFGDG
jgi:NAD(P)-dependent dehydrogenase (short-subunit alcohol dehydrogenase family)